MVLEFFRNLFNMARDKWRARQARKAAEAAADRVVFPDSSELESSLSPDSKLDWDHEKSEVTAAEREYEKKPNTTTLQSWKMCIDRLALHEKEKKAQKASQLVLGVKNALLYKDADDDTDSFVDDSDSLKKASHLNEEQLAAIKDFKFLNTQKSKYEQASEKIQIVEERPSSCWAALFACFRRKRRETTVSYSQLPTLNLQTEARESLSVKRLSQ